MSCGIVLLSHLSALIINCHCAKQQQNGQQVLHSTHQMRRSRQHVCAEHTVDKRYWNGIWGIPARNHNKQKVDAYIFQKKRTIMRLPSRAGSVLETNRRTWKYWNANGKVPKRMSHACVHSVWHITATCLRCAGFYRRSKQNFSQISFWPFIGLWALHSQCDESGHRQCCIILVVAHKWLSYRCFG